MKKVLAWLLLITLVLGAFAGCKGKNQPDVTEPSVKGAGAADAIEYLKGFYTDSGKKTPVDYTRFGIVRVGGVAFDVVWTVDVSEDMVKVVANADGTVTIDINEECEADTEYTLTATVTDAQGNTASHSWTYILPEGVDMVEVVKTAYALKPGESLPYESRLIGKIVSIDAVWTEDYQNVTVTIAVEGAEDMPIKCYRMKATDATIDAARNLLVGNIITVSGTIKNYEGTIEFDAGCILEKVEKGDAIEAPTDPIQIVKEAYALPENAALPYAAVLTGTVTAIDSPYDPQYGNLSVVITIEGAENYPILCYRLKGVDVEKIAIGDLITVNGIIKNYKGTIEYDAGCVMTNRVSGGGVAQGPSSDPAKIIPDALALKPGEKLPYRATLTGEIYSVDNAYDPNYGNVTVTILVQGYKIQCYRMVGDGIDQIRESDTITVSGVIENYNGKLEFGAKCTLDNWVVGPRTISYGPMVADVAYRLYMEQNGIGKTLYFDGTASSSGKLQTTTKGSKGADVFAERISGRGMRFYYMDGETKTYLEIEEYTNDSGKQRGRVKVTTEPTCYWVYDRETGVYVVNLPTAGKYFLGTYSTYDNISASWLGYIIDANASTVGVSQFVAKFIEADKVPADGPSQGGTAGEMVTAPEVGVPYKWGIEQGNKGVNLYFTGTMSGYYGATSENINDGVDVYLEAADGGYYITFKDASGAKKYITVVIKEDNGKTHRNFTIANAPSQVYTYNTQYNTLVTEVNGDELYFGTYDNYNTFSVSYFSKIASSFPAHFYVAGEGGEVEPDPTEPVAPGETIPVAVDELLDGYNVVIYAPAYNKALSADKVSAGSYYNKGTDITIANGEMTGYGSAEIWTVVDNGNGTYSFANNGQNIGLAEQYSSMNLGAIYDEWTLEYVGNGLYNIKNVGRGSYIEWYAEKDNWSTHTTSSVATSDLFQLSIYIIGKGLLGDTTEEPTPTEPTPSEPSTGIGMVTSPEIGVAYKWGIDQKGIAKMLYFNGEMAKTYYGGTTEDFDAAVDVVLEAADGGFYVAFTNASGAKKYINVVVNSTHRNFTIADKASTVYTWNEEYNTLETDVEGTACYIGTYGTFDTFSISSLDKIGNSYPSHFYAEGAGGEPEVTEPEATEPTVTEPSGGATGMITEPETGVAYKLYSVQNNVGKTLYFAGTTANQEYYFSTTEDAAAGTDVYLEAADGGYYLYFMKDGVKTYIDMVQSGTHYNLKMTTAPGVVYTFNTEYNTLVANVAGTDCYIGTYNQFITLSCSKFSYISSSFPSHLYGFVEGGAPEETEPEATEPEATEPSTGDGFNKITDASQFTSGKYVMIVNTGYAPGVYDNTWLSAVQPTVNGNVVTDTAGAVWTLTVNNDSVIITDANGVSIAPKGGANNGVIEKAYEWAWSFEDGTFVFAGTGEDAVYLASNTSTTGQYPGNHRFRGYKVSTIEKYPSEYPWQFTLYQLGGEYVEPEVTEPVVTEPTVTEPVVTEPSSGETGIVDPEVGKAYKFGFIQENVGTEVYYITGVKASYYMGTTTDVNAAADVYLEAADGGYYLYAVVNGAKKYINMVVNGTYVNAEFENKASTVYTYDAAKKTVVATVNDALYWHGTRNDNTYTTIGPVKVEYNGFYAKFYAVGQGGGSEGNVPEATEPEATEPAGAADVTIDFSTYPKGVQYATESYDLGNGVTLNIEDCHMNSQLRIYQDAKNGYDGKAVFSCGRVIQSLVINAGYRASGLEVYASVDGVNWELITVINHPAEQTYADYTVVMPAGTSYKYFMLDAPSTQMRVKTLAIAFKK